MIQHILAFAAEAIAQGQRIAWVTVLATRGSSPATAGQVMVVAADGGTAGTVGGGASEHAARERALRAIAAQEPTFTLAIDHAAQGMACGGGMDLVGSVLGMEARLVLFGGGHIAQALAPMAAAAGFSVWVVEDRAAFADAFPEARYVVCHPAEYPRQVALSPADYAVVCTRGHATDGEALRHCLGQPLAYTGMIGSRHKVAALMAALRAEGVPEETLRRVYAPIGLAIATGRPAEIAVAILAEILLVKNHGQPGHLRDVAMRESHEKGG